MNLTYDDLTMAEYDGQPLKVSPRPAKGPASERLDPQAEAMLQTIKADPGEWYLVSVRLGKGQDPKVIATNTLRKRGFKVTQRQERDPDRTLTFAMWPVEDQIVPPA